MEKYRIGKVCISSTNPIHAISSIEEKAKSDTPCYVCVTNLRMIRYAGTDKVYQELMHKSFMNLPDGTPLTWCGKLWGRKNIACTSGPYVFRKMMERGDNGVRHFLLGDTPDVLDALEKKYTKEYKTNIVGTFSPPFADVKDFDYEGIARLIKQSNADIVWTAMRAPKQDYFNQRLCEYLDKGVCIGVGRAFRAALGEFTPVPKWAKKLGLSGMYMRRKSLVATLWWYIQSMFYLAYYMLQIMVWRIFGCNKQKC